MAVEYDLVVIGGSSAGFACCWYSGITENKSDFNRTRRLVVIVSGMAAFPANPNHMPPYRLT